MYNDKLYHFIKSHGKEIAKNKVITKKFNFWPIFRFFFYLFRPILDHKSDFLSDENGLKLYIIIIIIILLSYIVK